ncbi:MAG: hypothetical protein RQ752_12520, partial [Thermohalobaculum sp.]|nr:hypothetical protein [Thermohalobaculum sp.]
RIEGRARDADTATLTAAQRRREAALGATPAPGRSADDIARERRSAVVDEAGARRAVEIDAQRRAAADRAARRPAPGIGRDPFEASDAYTRRVLEGASRPPPVRSRAPGGALPDLGPVTLP